MAKIRDGDLHGFTPLYLRHHIQVEAAARAMVGRSTMTDLANEAFARLLLILLDGGTLSTGARCFLKASARETFCKRVAVSVGRATGGGSDGGPGSVFAGMLAVTDSSFGLRSRCPAPAALPEDWCQQLRAIADEHLLRVPYPGRCRSAETVMRLTCRTGQRHLVSGC
ncbi:MAG TPA: hypothetical protein VHZ06_02525 [Marmoricola sp.]|nr:hypothetical protein [Marmoricola sp.]